MNEQDKKAFELAYKQKSEHWNVDKADMLSGFKAAIAYKEKQKIEPVGWIFEDELPLNYPYDAMFPFSKVNFVRMFPVYAPPLEFKINQELIEALEKISGIDGDTRLFHDIANAALKKVKELTK